MSWTGLVLTDDGISALNQAQINNRLNIKSIVVGDGPVPENFTTIKGLAHQLYEITALKISLNDGECTITADLPNLDYNYYFREIGVIVSTDEGDRLYVYDNCGDDAQYIVTRTAVEETERRIRLSLSISNVAHITVSDPELLYVAYDSFEQLQDNVEKLQIGVSEEVSRAKEAEKVIADNLESHIENTDNPHKITKLQLGLENIDNTSDLDKPISLAASQRFSAVETLASEARNIAVGKNQARIFNTTEDMISWLKNAANKGAAKVGDNLYIIDVGVPDWWISEVLNTADTEGCYYHIAKLETQKVDLSNYLEKTGNTANNTVTYTSGDAAGPTAWSNVDVLKSGEKHSSILNKISTMVKNLRWLYKVIGMTDISGIGNGTLTGGLSALNRNLSKQIMFSSQSLPAKEYPSKEAVTFDISSYLTVYDGYIRDISAFPNSDYLLCQISAVDGNKIYLTVYNTYNVPLHSIIHIEQLYFKK